MKFQLPARSSRPADLSPALDFDAVLRKRYSDSEDRFRRALSRLSPDVQQRCLRLVEHLRVYKHLFLHTYAHLAICCQGRDLHRLEGSSSHWNGWSSVQQLARHTLISDTLFSFGAGATRCQHSSLFTQRSSLADDEGDLLCLLLYCGRKSELYDLVGKPTVPGRAGGLREYEQVIELLWEFVLKYQEESDVARRLRASIYRMARKSAYLPRALQIRYSSMSPEKDLGAGAHGMVTVAKMNGKDVVIKRILASDYNSQHKCLQMFASEAILWKTLQHKNIVPFLGVITEGFNTCLVSPLFKNGSVRKYIKSYKPADWPALATRWGRDIAQGLEYIHSHEPPIIHGDLKADNVLVDDDRHARIGDFGQSHASDSGKYLDSTRVGLALYNPLSWMAPEIMGDDAKATEKSDIYSFGCVLYEMVSGDIPFQGLTTQKVMDLVLSGVRPKRPESIGVDSPLWKVIETCWSKRPEDRPSAARLVSRLR